jgi:hypothetical protein
MTRERKQLLEFFTASCHPFLGKEGKKSRHSLCPSAKIGAPLVSEDSTKKQIKPNIKAHLIRGAFYLLPFLAVYLIPYFLVRGLSPGPKRSSRRTPLQNFFLRPDVLFLSARQRQSDITGSMRRATTFGIGAAAVVVLAAAVISSSRAIAPRADEDDGSGRSDIPVALVASSPPQCPFCWQPVEFTINFDDVTPPALPQGFIATNVQGPPPLWVTSNSGLPTRLPIHRRTPRSLMTQP